MPDNTLPKDDLLSNLDKVDHILRKQYLHELADAYSVIPFATYNKGNHGEKTIKISVESNIRFVHVARWIYDADESIADRFKNILGLFSGTETDIALIIRRSPREANMWFALKSETKDTSVSETMKHKQRLLENSLRGNFSGSILRLEQAGFSPFTSDTDRAIACLTNIPSAKSEKYISQGLDKLLNGIVPLTDKESYTLVILAQPLTPKALKSMVSGYEELASAIQPYASHQFSAGTSKAETNSEFSTLSNTHSVNRSLTKTHGFSAGASVTVPLPAVAIAPSIGYSHSRSRTEGTSDARTSTAGSTYGLTDTMNENTTFQYKSHSITRLLDKLEAQMKRGDLGAALGMWNYASYVLSGSNLAAENAAAFLRSLTQGDNSFIEPPALNLWTKSKETTCFDEIYAYIKHMTHPIFFNQEDVRRSGGKIMDDDTLCVTPTCFVTTTELADVMAFPRHSVPGLPVVECVSFGRDVIERPSDVQRTENRKELALGSIYHMQQVENSQVALVQNELTKHTFITGSTGSGKSNAVYQMLDRLTKKSVRFLVIEPAKGEYKNVLGCRDDVRVYGTNAQYTPLLRIDPFAFPEGIHVLEHLDRLIEIFNVCWPMYAAMPAILKDAIEQAYIAAGWDLTASVNRLGVRLFPTFADVLMKIRSVLQSSDYSADSKGDYMGALVSRLKSLTNGINGLIFTPKALTDGELFDENVIVDLSRVGSMETKSMIMGLMVLRLQEYRMTQDVMNNGLIHVTVLEEAHNLLKRTSTEQSSESSNLIGKSVEMLANAIAEMRTYGEGFIIVDQSPGLLDMSSIRNTNTKIILRTPEYTDRLLVGRAASLNDEQIVELSKLSIGVAAVYQSNWLEPVLCKVDYFSKNNMHAYKYVAPVQPLEGDTSPTLLSVIAEIGNSIRNEAQDVRSMKERLMGARGPASIKADILRKLNEDTEANGIIDALVKAAATILDAPRVFEDLIEVGQIETWRERAVALLGDALPDDQNEMNTILMLVLLECAARDTRYKGIGDNFLDFYIGRRSL